MQSLKLAVVGSLVGVSQGFMVTPAARACLPSSNACDGALTRPPASLVSEQTDRQSTPS